MRSLVLVGLLTGCVGPSVFVDKAGDGDGTIVSDPDGIECGDSCGTLHSGAMVLTATPAEGSELVGWEGACTGTDTCTLDITENTDVIARFVLKGYELATSTTAGGSVASRPEGIACGGDCSEVFKHGTRIILTPTAAPGHSFMGWDALECETTSNCILDLVEPRQVHAVFAPHQELRVSYTQVGGGGIVTSTPAGIEGHGKTVASFPFGEQVTLTATPDPMSAFTGWSGDCSGTQPSCTVVMDRARHVVASFGPKPRHALSIALAGTGTGTVTSSPGINCPGDCSESYVEGVQMTLWALSSVGSAFAGWSGDCSGTQPSCTVVMDRARNVTATFTPKQQHMVSVVLAGTGTGTVTAVGSGISCPGDCSESYLAGSSLMLSAVSASGSVFAGWSVSGCSGTSCTTTVQAPMTITATFNATTACTTTVTASESATAFNARLTSPSSVICLAAGITISGAVTLGAGNVTIRGLSGGTVPRLVNTNGTAVNIGDRLGIVLDNVDIEARGPELTPAISVPVGSVEIRDSFVRCNSQNCYVVKLATMGRATIKRSTLLGGVATQSFSYGVYGSAASFTIEDTEISSHGATLWIADGSTATVTRSLLRSLNSSVGGDVAAIEVYNSAASLMLRDSEVSVVGSDVIHAGGAASGVTVTLDNTEFRKVAGVAAGNYSPFISERADNHFNSTAANVFCNEGTSTTDGQFAKPWISGSIGVMSSFNNVSHAGPANCTD